MRNIRIGVVEDDPASCQLVLDYLNRYQQENGEQFTVSVFDDGARIVEKYTPVYDILLLDIEMSEMDGMAAARRIRERDDKVVIVFITAAPQYAISGYEVRALSYLLKPLPWFAFSQELKKSIDMVRRNGDDSTSLLLNPPGILPTEYIFSSYSTESGKKSMPSRGLSDAVTVESTVVSPYFNKAAPFACAQTLPISTVSVLPASSIEKLLYMRILLF